MIQIYKEIRPYNFALLLTGLLLLIGAGVVSFLPKGDLLIFLNTYHNKVLDHFFYYLTNMGDGLIFLPLVLIAFLIDKRLGIYYLLVGLMHAALVSIGKYILFENSPRPIIYLKQYTLHLVEGLKVHKWNSFPSGHTATVFAACTAIILFLKSKLLQVLMIIIACLAGISRVYLCQHFFQDVFIGAVLGVVSPWFLWKVYYFPVVLMKDGIQ
ncbi:phosphatase PAP2 family protein [Limibacter armeniacum]|uniref:phosphatase PAP2 family protein n=1 Tax=Limibacter armeniacum TaxID=466084 RepID=UPI002FE64B8A